MKTARPIWAIPLTIVCMFAAILVGVAPASLLLPREHLLRQPLAALGVAAAMVLFIYLWRRFLLRRRWSGVGLRWSGRAIPQALLGVAVAAAAALAANAASVAAGFATWSSWSEQGGYEDRIGYGILATVSMIVVLQAFPEELLWRGHLYDLLATNLSRWPVLLLTSGFFGVLHIASNGGTDGAGERFLYVLMAIALGFAAGAARARTGAVWMAIGVHAGFHGGIQALPVEASNYAIWLALLAVTMTVSGLLILGRSPARAARASRPVADASAEPPARLPVAAGQALAPPPAPGGRAAAAPHREPVPGR